MTSHKSKADYFASNWPIGDVPPLAYCLLAVACKWHTQRYRVCKIRWINSHLEKHRLADASRHKATRKNSGDKVRLRDKSHYSKRRVEILKWKREHRDDINARKRELRKENLHKHRSRARAQYRVKCLTPRFKVRMNLHRKMSKLIRFGKSSILRYLGCSFNQFASHVERLFAPGMTWGNYGKCGWHIDHIVPISKFDLSNPYQLRQCFHWTNLRPLWAKDNYAKHAKIGFEYGNVQPCLPI